MRQGREYSETERFAVVRDDVRKRVYFHACGNRAAIRDFEFHLGERARCPTHASYSRRGFAQIQSSGSSVGDITIIPIKQLSN